MITKLRSKFLKTDIQQYRIAGITGIHPSRLSEYALNQKPIPPHHLAKLCEFFQCDASDLVGMTDEYDIVDTAFESRPA